MNNVQLLRLMGLVNSKAATSGVLYEKVFLEISQN